MTDIYKAPSADMVEKTIPFSGSGSLESGIAGQYDFSVGDVLGEARKRISGNKGTAWLALICYLIPIIIVSMVVDKVVKLLGFTIDDLTYMHAFTRGYVMQVLKSCITMPFSAGVFMVCIKLAVRAPVDFSEIFRYFDKYGPLIALMLLRSLLVTIGFCLLLVPGIYLSVAYCLSVPLMVEKNLGPWEALEASRKAVHHHWFKFFFTYLSMTLIIIASLVLLLFGVIWSAPMGMLVNGILYRTVFGYQGEVAATPDPISGEIA